MKRMLAVIGLGALVAIGLGIASPALTELAAGRGKPAPKVFVCKYVGQPGVDERLQTGDNPISVSANSIKEWNGENPGNLIGLEFADAHGRSIVIAIDEGQPEPDVSECPTPPGPTKGKLIVHKVVVNDDGGTKTASDFSFTVDGTPYVFDADGANELELAPGEYHIGEVAVAGYESWIDHRIARIASTEVTTVTITNDDTPPKPPVVPPTETTPTETTPTETTPTETTPTETTPTETTPTETTPTETTPAETTPTAPLTPPTTPKKPAEKKAPAKAKPAPLTPPKKAVAGVQKKAATGTETQPKLAYTP